jgi:hypothetical protein
MVWRKMETWVRNVARKVESFSCRLSRLNLERYFGYFNWICALECSVCSGWELKRSRNVWITRKMLNKLDFSGFSVYFSSSMPSMPS